MKILRILRTFALAATALAVLSTIPAQAQQRIQISDLLQRLSQVESEVARLRVASGSGGGGDLQRLDLIEQELRRLTGIVERLEYEARQSGSASEKRLETLEKRLAVLEDRPPAAAPAPAPGPVISSPQGPATSFPGPAEPGLPQYSGAPLETAPPAEGVFRGAEPVQSASALYDEGLRLLNLGSYDEAGAQFEDLVATYPADPKAGQAQYWLGDMHFKLGRLEQAAAAFLDSFRRWPNGPRAPDSLLKLGMTLATIGKTDEACLSFQQVGARYPGADPALLRRADIEAQRFRCAS